MKYCVTVVRSLNEIFPDVTEDTSSYRSVCFIIDIRMLQMTTQLENTVLAIIAGLIRNTPLKMTWIRLIEILPSLL
jgi:hypothetical protein